MKQIKKMPSLFYRLLILVLIAQMILLPPYLAQAQGIETKPGLLDIETTESGVTITIDQKEHGKAPLHDIQLSPGTHKVVAKKKGYEDWSDEVVVEPGVHSSIVAVLKKLGEAPITPLGETQVTPSTTIPEAATPKPPEEVIQKPQTPITIIDVISEPPPPPCTRIWCRWWFWTLVLLVAGGGVAAVAGGGGGGGGAPGTTSSPTTGTVSVTW